MRLFMNANNAKPPIRTEMRDRTLWIWIDREERRNAINKEVISGIASAAPPGGRLGP